MIAPYSETLALHNALRAKFRETFGRDFDLDDPDDEELIVRAARHVREDVEIAEITFGFTALHYRIAFIEDCVSNNPWEALINDDPTGPDDA